nr:hypothetical protein [Halorarius litoreus]
MIYYLRTHGGKAEVTDLAKHVAAWEYDIDPEELDDQQQKRVYVSLYQTHVPKLADIGIVNYDSETRMVELTDRATEVEEFVNPAAGDERQWQWYYLGLSVLSFTALALAAFDLPPLGGVSDIAVGIAVGIAFAALAVTHYVMWGRERRELPEELRSRE